MSDQYKTRTEKRQVTEGKKKASRKTTGTGKGKGKGKRFLLIIVLIVALGFVSGGAVFAYWVSSAPELNVELLKDPVSSKVYDMNKDLYAEIGSQNRDYVEYENIPELLENAVLATEDSRFYKHHGVDLIRLGGAVIANVTNGFGSQGGSTITQQVIKNAFLTPEKTPKRKVQEMWMAFKLEQKYSKKAILEMYINKVYMSSGIHGIATASDLYFGKPLDKLTLPEAATLAGMPQSPNNYNPFDYPEKAEKRRNIVLSLMNKHGYISEAEMKKAQTAKLVSSLVGEKDRKVDSNKIDSIVDLVIDEVDSLGDYNIYTDGLEIYTSIDPKAQAYMEKLLNTDEIVEYPDDEFQAGVTLLDTKTGEVRAIGGGRKQTVERGYNFAVDLKNRQPGSTIKPILDYGPAIEYKQWSTYHQIVDEPFTYSSGEKVSNAGGSYKGQVTIREALYRSLNIPAIKALKEVGTNKAAKFAQGLGLPIEDDITESAAIGGLNRSGSPLEMAGAFATFGNNGIYNKPHVVKKVVFRDKDSEINATPKSEVAMKDYTAFMVTNMLKDVLTKGTGINGQIAGLPAAAKTGTTNYTEDFSKKYNIPSNHSPDSWFIGYTSNYTVSVWTGYADQKQSLDKQMTRIASKIYKNLMGEMSKGITTEDFKMPKSVVKVGVERNSNPPKLPSEFTPKENIVYEYFVKGTEPKQVSEKFDKIDEPSNVRATYDSAKKEISLDWNYTSQNESKPEFEVNVSIDEGAQKLLTVTSDKSLKIAKPIEGAKYTFFVTAIISDQKSKAISASITIPEAEIEKPTIPDPITPNPGTDQGDDDTVQPPSDDGEDDNGNNNNETNPGQGTTNPPPVPPVTTPERKVQE